MKWVTREYVHVDRTACPWLIKKFIDPEAEFIFVPPEKIEETAKKKTRYPSTLLELSWVIETGNVVSKP